MDLMVAIAPAPLQSTPFLANFLDNHPWPSTSSLRFPCLFPTYRLVRNRSPDEINAMRRIRSPNALRGEREVGGSGGPLKIRKKLGRLREEMASICCSTALLPLKPSISSSFWVSSNNNASSNKMLSSFSVKAAKLPVGVVVPKVEPKFKPPFAGFTRVAETWNSRACMIGLIATFILELIMNKGILQVIGVDVGKGLDLPL